MLATPSQGSKTSTVIDENAFGLALAYYDIEEEEYGLEDSAEFVRRFRAFEAAARGALARAELPEDRLALGLGHSIYFEFHDAGDTPRLVSQARQVSTAVLEAGFRNALALAFGSRWVDPEAPTPGALQADAGEVRLAGPSEPLRRCLAATALAMGDDQVPGWGPAVYVDLDAAEAVGLKLKNRPTLLRAGGADFFRIPVSHAKGTPPGPAQA